MNKMVLGGIFVAAIVGCGGKIDGAAGGASERTSSLDPAPSVSSAPQPTPAMPIASDRVPGKPLFELGASCAADEECASGLCNVPGTSHGFCTKPCADKSACGGDFECIDWGFTGGYCFVGCAPSNDKCNAVPDARCIVYPSASDGSPVAVCVQ